MVAQISTSSSDTATSVLLGSESETEGTFRRISCTGIFEFDSITKLYTHIYCTADTTLSYEGGLGDSSLMVEYMYST